MCLVLSVVYGICAEIFYTLKSQKPTLFWAYKGLQLTLTQYAAILARHPYFVNDFTQFSKMLNLVSYWASWNICLPQIFNKRRKTWLVPIATNCIERSWQELLGQWKKIWGCLHFERTYYKSLKNKNFARRKIIVARKLKLERNLNSRNNVTAFFLFSKQFQKRKLSLEFLCTSIHMFTYTYVWTSVVLEWMKNFYKEIMLKFINFDNLNSKSSSLISFQVLANFVVDF